MDLTVKGTDLDTAKLGVVQFSQHDVAPAAPAGPAPLPAAEDVDWGSRRKRRRSSGEERSGRGEVDADEAGHTPKMTHTHRPHKAPGVPQESCILKLFIVPFLGVFWGAPEVSRLFRCV